VESTTNLEMLVDENQLSADDFNRESLGRFLFVESESAYTYSGLVYGLCSTYARATTSVAIVPPSELPFSILISLTDVWCVVYYADQACERSRLHLQDKQDGTKFLPTVHKNLSWRMVRRLKTS
jgi:hypothetical protein